MPRLFWKLFISFWAALLIYSGGLMLATSHYLDSARISSEVTNSSGRLSERTASARAAVSGGGLQGLREWASEIDRHEIAPLLVLDDGGHDLLDRKPSYRAMRHLQRNLSGEDQRSHDHLVLVPPEQKRYWVITDVDGVTLGRLIARPSVVWTELVLATLIGGAACLFLAVYLTAPLKHLKAAAQAYGEGRFGMKVAPSLGQRRDEVVDLAMAMDDMGGRIEDLLESKRRLLRDVSHELRSPLARIQAAIGLVRQGGPGVDVEASIGRIETEASRMNELIGQLLTRARLETHPIKLRQDPLKLRSLVDEVTASAGIEAAAKGMDLQCSLLLDDAPIRGDALLLRSAIDNVVRNAVCHTPNGGKIRVSLQRSGDDPSAYLLEVTDNGSGIPAPMLDRIFEPFVRVDEWCAQDNKSTGLGLSIAKLAVEAHGGRIAASNRAGGGLQVRIALPDKPPTQG